MNYQAINLKEKLSKFAEYWSPKNVAQMDNYHFKLVKIKGEFVWHDHQETDEVFLILKGQLEIQFRDGKVLLHEGEMFVVPKRLEHRPIAAEECHLMLIEQAGTVNTGNVVDVKTSACDVWI